MSRLAVIVAGILLVGVLQAEEYQPRYRGTVYLSTVNAGPLNVREEPSLEADILTTVAKGERVVVTGVSEHSENIDGHLGHWLRVSNYRYRDYPEVRLGWVFSKYLDDVSRVAPSLMEIAGFEPSPGRSSARLTISMGRPSGVQTYSVRANHLWEQDFYTFTWSVDQPGFRYSDVPGTYLYYPDSRKIDHVSYEGDSMESAWVRFTDDLRYMLQDFGTGPGLRGLGVTRVDGGSVVFSGSYYGDLNLSNDALDIAYKYYPGSPQGNTELDEETKERALGFVAANPRTKWADVLIRYRLHFRTGKREFLECIYVEF